ncbi:hypothetical protein FS837_002331 [Tulasnella sp. UAMH 9824]|nr:hypothetical protein FS837_002331 [Tulasnella sp. UAMH 9824]
MAPQNKGKDAAVDPQIFKAPPLCVDARMGGSTLQTSRVRQIAADSRWSAKSRSESTKAAESIRVPLDRCLLLTKQYNIGHFIQPIVDLTSQFSGSPLAPRHLAPASVKPKKKTNVTSEEGSIATRSAKRGDQASGPTMAVGDDDGEADAIGEDDDFSEMVGEGESRYSSPQANEDGSMASSPSDAFSSSRTASPYNSPADGPGGGNGAVNPFI